MQTQVDHLQRAIALLGGPVKAASVLCLRSYQVLQQWRVNRVPADYCPAIEKATGGDVRCEALRPDVDWAYLRATDCSIEKVGAGETAFVESDRKAA